MAGCCYASFESASQYTLTAVSDMRKEACFKPFFLVYLDERSRTVMENELLENINSRLGIIIGLLIRSLPDAGEAEVQDRVLMLSDMGMRPKDIALALATSTNNVNVTLSRHRNASKKTKRGKR